MPQIFTHDLSQNEQAPNFGLLIITNNFWHSLLLKQCNTIKPRFWNTFAAKILLKNRFFAAGQNFLMLHKSPGFWNTFVTMKFEPLLWIYRLTFTIHCKVTESPRTFVIHQITLLPRALLIQYWNFRSKAFCQSSINASGTISRVTCGYHFSCITFASGAKGRSFEECCDRRVDC